MHVHVCVPPVTESCEAFVSLVRDRLFHSERGRRGEDDGREGKVENERRERDGGKEGGRKGGREGERREKDKEGGREEGRREGRRKRTHRTIFQETSPALR